MNQPFVLKQEPFEIYPLQGARLPFVPIKGTTGLHFAMPAMHRDRPMAQTGPRLRKVGQILILPDDNTSPVYGEIPLFYSGDDPDLFLGKLVKQVSSSVGRAVKSAAHAVADLSSSVADTLGKVPLIGAGLKGLYGFTYGALIQAADNVVSGVRLDKVASRYLESQVQNVKGVAPYVQTIISVVPGIGPGISGAISAGLTLAQGRPIDEALVDAVAGAVPGGALAKSVAKAGFAAASGKPLSDIAISALQIPPAAKDALKAGLRVASDVAQGKRVDKSFLAEANRQIDRLPPAFRKAAQVGVALGQGKKVQDIAKEQLPRLIAVGGPLAAAGQKIASNSPIVRQARGLVAKGQHGFDVAQGLMAHSAVPRHQLARARSAFKGEALKGFDTAVALHVGRVLSPPRPIKKGPSGKVRRLKGTTGLHFEMPAMHRDRPMAQTGPRLRKVGQILILPDDNTSPVYGEIPLFYSGDDPDLFLGGLVRRVSNVVKDVGRVAQKAAGTVGKAVETVKRATGPLGAITDFAWRMSPAGQAVTWGRRGFEAASALARGERIDRVLRRAAQAGIDDVRERLKFAEMVAPFVPGLGTGVAAALGAANALASGKPITEALIAAARSAIPGGKIAQGGFDVAMNLARGKNLSESALSAMRAQLPGGPAAQAAFDAGLALAQGKKLQDAAFAAAGRVLPPSRFAADALSFARAVASGQNVQQAALSTVGQRVLQGKKVDPPTRNMKRELPFG